MSDTDISEIIKIVTQFTKQDVPIEPETKLMDEGLIDSLNFFHIIAELEDLFGIDIGVMDVTAADFNSLQAIASLVDRMKAK